MKDFGKRCHPNLKMISWHHGKFCISMQEHNSHNMLLYLNLVLLAGLAHFSEQARSGAFRLRGDIIAVGRNNHLYMRRSTSAHYRWMLLPRSCCVTQIHILPNGAILGVGTNKHLYIKRTPFSLWRHIPNSCCVKDVTTFRANRRSRTYIVGIGMDGKLYSKTSLNSRWYGPYPNSGTVKAVAGVTGRIYGISMRGRVYRRDLLDDCEWTLVPKSCCVKDISVQDSGRHLAYGVGNNLRLYTAFLNVGVGRPIRWHYQGSHTCCVKAVQVRRRRIIASIIGVTKKWNLLFKAHQNGYWTSVPGSGAVRHIVVLRDGKIVGIGLDYQLYVRATIDHKLWHRVPLSGSVKSVAQLKDGRIIGVGLDNKLYVRNKLYGRWIKKTAKSGSFTSITVDRRSGIIFGVGLNKKLYTRKRLCSRWHGPLRNSGSPRDIKFGSDGYLYGVGQDWRVYKKATKSVTSHWRKVPHSCCVRSIAVS